MRQGDHAAGRPRGGAAHGRATARHTRRMPAGARLLAFLATAAVLVAIPGPSLLFTIGRALTLGRRDALLTVVGNALGLLVQAALVAVGLGAVLAASSTAYTVVKLAGAAYLVYLGVQAIRHRHELAAALGPRGEGATGPGGQPGRSLGQGFVVGLTNPKTLVFLGSLLPQFVDPAYAAAPQILALGGLFAALALVGDSVWALAASRARTWFASSPSRLGRLGSIGGTLMVGLGLTVAAGSRSG